jgi:hypothetical protein
MKRGFTLVEIIIYGFLSLLVLMTVYAIFSSGRDAYSTVTDAYLLGKDAEAGLRTLRTDLQETAAASIRIADAANGDSSISMLSPRKPGSNEFVTANWGMPQWQKYVHYTVVQEGDTASLLRWEEKIADLTSVQFPLPSSASSDAPPSDAVKKMALRNLVFPKSGALGARHARFQARFVRYDTSSTVTEKTTASGVATDEGGEPISLLVLYVTVSADPTRGDKTRFIQLPIYVSPRY